METSTKMNVERLHTLVALLRDIERRPQARDRFRMSTWGTAPLTEEDCAIYDEYHDTDKLEIGIGIEPDCQTSACAGGWACSIPSFREAGLRLEIAGMRDGVKVAQVIYKHPTAPSGYLSGTYALAAFFGLNDKTAEIVFGTVSRTPAYEADLIEWVIKNEIDGTRQSDADRLLEQDYELRRRYNPSPLPDSMQEAHRRREVLGQFLIDQVPASRFNMMVYTNGDSAPTLEPECRTSGCALGWATQVPEFKNRLKMVDGIPRIVRYNSCGVEEPMDLQAERFFLYCPPGADADMLVAALRSECFSQFLPNSSFKIQGRLLRFSEEARLLGEDI